MRSWPGGIIETRMRTPGRRTLKAAIGELAFCKARGLYWPATVNTFRKQPDVYQYEIRTRSKPDYQLNVRPDAKDHAPYVLVRGMTPRFHLVGWIYARDAKQRPDWSKTYGGHEPAFFVPDKYLHDMATLPAPVLPGALAVSPTADDVEALFP